MPKPKGNPQWSQGMEPAIPSGPSEFERIAARLKLSPEHYENSMQLRTWVEKNWRQKFVPERLLEVWRFSESPLQD